MKQQEIDFTAVERRSMIKHAVLPRGLRVSPSILKLVLTVIDSYGRECFASQETIARDCGLRGRKTINRAIAILEELSLLTKELKGTARGGNVNHYRIVWTELDLLGKQTAGQHGRDGTRRSHLSGTGDGTLSPGDGTLSPGDGTLSPGDGTRRSHESSSKEKELLSNRGEAAKRFFFDDDQKATAQYVADRLTAAVRLRTAADRSMAVKVSLLTAAGDLSQDDVEQAIESVRLKRPENPAAWFHRCLDNSLAGRFNELLSSVPDDVLPKTARCST